MASRKRSITLGCAVASTAAAHARTSSVEPAPGGV
jgi:hypothetical protein